MKNYIAEFMKDNGLVEGQEFKIKGYTNALFSFKDNILIEKNIHTNFENIANTLFRHLMSTKATIEHLPFKPKQGEYVYFYTFSNCRVCQDRFSLNNTIDLSYFKMGNCFRTKEECEANIPKIKQMYEDIRKELQE